jgi:hypothetical protein
VDLIIESYALETTTAFRFADLLYQYCTFDELMALKWLLNYFHEHHPWIATKYFSSGRVRKTLQQRLLELGSYLAHLATWKQRSMRLEKRTFLQMQAIRTRLFGSFSNL